MIVLSGYRRSLRQRGSVMILALVVMVFAVVIAATFGRQAVLGKSMAAKERQLSQAYYAAESVLNDFLAHPAAYMPDGYLPLDNSSADDLTITATDTEDLFPGEPGLTYELEVKWLRSDIYEVRSLGSTPYATALAAAEVRLDELTGPFLDTAYHIGGLGVPLTVPGTPGNSLRGNAAGVNYHFTGSDMAIYGVLDFERNPATGEVLQSKETFNIWDGDFLTWNWLEDVPPIMPDWLLDKSGNLEEDAEFPEFVADYLRASALSHVPVANYLPGDGNTTTLSIGTWDAGSPVEGRIVCSGALRNNINLEGLGYLRLESTTPAIISKLTMHGDLTIIAKGDIQIASINDGQTTQIHDTQGYRLNIISDGSIKIGPNAADYDPYPYFAQARNDCFFLGDKSILWAQGSLVISGQVRSGSPEDYPEQLAVNFDPEDPASQIIVWNASLNGGDGGIEPSPDPIGKLILVSKGTAVDNESSLTMHTFDSGGIVYAGDRIQTFRIRLHGPAFVEDPYEIRRIRGDDVVGLAELNLVATDENIFDDLELGEVYAKVIRRLK